MIVGMLVLAIAAAAAIAGFTIARRFVRNRLRFVDAAQRPIAPVIAGVVAACVAVPFAWMLPLVGTGTALLFGAGVAGGVAAGARDIRHGTNLPRVYGD